MALKQKPNYSIKWMYFVTRISYYIGLGECWYDAPVKSSLNKKIYSFLSCLSTAFLAIMATLQIASIFKRNKTEDEKYDAVLFGCCHPFIVLKGLNMRFKNERIKKLLRVLLVETKLLFVEERLEEAQVKKAIKYSAILLGSAILTVSSGTIDSAKRHFKQGLPMRTIITYYPDYDNLSWQADLVRWIAQYYWWHLAAVMVISDFLAVTCLIYLSFQFKTLQHYFKSLNVTFERNELGKSQIELEDDLNRAFVAGINWHNTILWCARDVQENLGYVYSVQVSQSLLGLVFCLLKFVNSEHSFTNVFATGMFISTILVLTGIYMWSSGDVTLEKETTQLSVPLAMDVITKNAYKSQASLVGDAMFHSGWHLCSARARMRTLLVLGIQRSQVPVVMTAFGVIELSYENFIYILKKSYSVFAVFY